jgi:glyoxylase-like metal-dependent hydrolase (beta-lactamase superfamily II)
MDIYTIPGREYDSNIYVIIGKVPTVIDTGTGFHSPQVLETIQHYIQPKKIQQILLTHEHYDHVGGVRDLVLASAGTAKIYAQKDIVSKLEEGKSTFAEMLGGSMPKIAVDVPLSGEELLTLGDEPFTVLATPGHSIGSICFYGKKSHTLFSGDTIFAHGDFGRYDSPGGDFTCLLHSIQQLATLDVHDLYPGHGPIVKQHGTDHVRKALQSIQSLM